MFKAVLFCSAKVHRQVRNVRLESRLGQVSPDGQDKMEKAGGNGNFREYELSSRHIMCLDLFPFPGRGEES